MADGREKPPASFRAAKPNRLLPDPDKAADRKAAQAYERERQRREREEAKEEAARQKQRERRQQAVEKAQAALDKAEREHDSSGPMLLQPPRKTSPHSSEPLRTKRGE